MWSVIFVSVTAYVVTGEMACPPLEPNVDPNGLVMNAPAGYCFYVYVANMSGGDQKRNATRMCQQLSPAPHRWYLPKLDTLAKLAEVETILDSVVIDGRWWFWLGLDRDRASRQEAMDLQQWAEPPKWRWSSDNSILDTSFVDESIPWGQNQLDNWRCIDANCRMGVESCVTVHHTPDAPQLKWPWNDRTCYLYPTAFQDIWTFTAEM